MFIVVLTVYFICTYLSEFIEPLLQLLYIPTFRPFFSKFGNLEIFIFVILYVYFILFLFLLTQDFALERIHKVVVSPRSLSSILCQMYPEG